MTEVVIVGTGPAGMRAAITLAGAGLKPIVIDEAARRGGQVYRAPPLPFDRSPESLYGFEAGRAKALHGAFDALGSRIDYRPLTAVWTAEADRIHTIGPDGVSNVRWDRLILATGATDRVIPVEGWTLPGVFTLGGAQTLLKAQYHAIGARIVFLGTGPLLYLVAYQHAKAGFDVAAVLDTATFARQFGAVPELVRGGATFLKGLWYVARLRGMGVPVRHGIAPVEVLRDPQADRVAGFVYREAGGRERRIACDALALGYGLRSETQLADILDLAFRFDPRQRQWLPTEDGDGRSSNPHIYLAGDGARVRGAEIAEQAGERAALTLLDDLRHDAANPERRGALSRAIGRAERFRQALDERAFPFPAHLARELPDTTVVCRCEAITARTLRRAAMGGASEINRVKAFTRLGMGRCQGRVCGAAATEILAAEMDVPLSDVGRLRAQAPLKPVPLAALTEGQA